jgi:hypothetical protein
MVDTADDFTAALAVALRIRAWLVLLLLLILAGELAIFFFFHYQTSWQPRAQDLLQYCMGLIEFFGVSLAILLLIDLLVTLNITLSGRLGGAANLVSALIGSTVLILFLFPWQAFLANATFTSADFKIPGVLYTWEELATRARWDSSSLNIWQNMLRWARFVVFPFVAILVLHSVWRRSGIRKN